MTILDNYMFRPTLAIFRFFSTELKVLLYTFSAHVMGRSLHPGFVTQQCPDVEISPSRGCTIYRVIQKDGLNWTVNGASTHARQLVAVLPSSLLSLRVHLRELRSKLSCIHLTFSPDTRGRPELLPLHRQPVCSNWWFQRQTLFLVGGWILKRRQNSRCTAVGDANAKNLVQHSSHFVLNWRYCMAVR